MGIPTDREINSIDFLIEELVRIRRIEVVFLTAGAPVDPTKRKFRKIRRSIINRLAEIDDNFGATD